MWLGCCDEFSDFVGDMQSHVGVHEKCEENAQEIDNIVIRM
jgi:hypothetical protein